MRRFNDNIPHHCSWREGRKYVHEVKEGNYGIVHMLPSVRIVKRTVHQCAETTPQWTWSMKMPQPTGRSAHIRGQTDLASSPSRSTREFMAPCCNSGSVLIGLLMQKYGLNDEVGRLQGLILRQRVVTLVEKECWRWKVIVLDYAATRMPLKLS